MESKQWGWPSTAYDATEIKLQQFSARPFQILAFSHEYATMKIQMVWVSPKHLDIRFGPSDGKCDHVDMDFQAIQAGGVEISTEAFPGPANTVRC